MWPTPNSQHTKENIWTSSSYAQYGAQESESIYLIKGKTPVANERLIHIYKGGQCKRGLDLSKPEVRFWAMVTKL